MARFDCNFLLCGASRNVSVVFHISTNVSMAHCIHSLTWFAATRSAMVTNVLRRSPTHSNKALPAALFTGDGQKVYDKE